MSYLKQDVVEPAGAVTLIEIDRPPANAMNVELLEEIVEALEQLAGDPPTALVLAGREGFFSGGVDLKEVPGYGPEEQRRMVTGINRMVLAGYGLPCPVLGAITGHAIAGGLVLALCCDYRIASDAGRYGLTEIKVGVPYPQAALGVVRAELGPAAARKLVLGSELTGAEECLRLGVFDEIVAGDAVLPRAVELAAQMAGLPSDVYARTKLDLRGPALSAMREAAQADPLLERWVQHRRPSAGSPRWSAGVRSRKTSLTVAATTECANSALDTRDDFAHSHFAAQVSEIAVSTRVPQRCCRPDTSPSSC